MTPDPNDPQLEFNLDASARMNSWAAMRTPARSERPPTPCPAWTVEPSDGSECTEDVTQTCLLACTATSEMARNVE